MSLKKKLAMGIATGALAVSMIGGGTYAYFSDTEVNESTFAAGTLDINVKGNDKDHAIIDVGTLKPGDTMTRNFQLNNTGNLNVSKVILTSDYTVNDVLSNNAGADFGEHIKVQFLYNNDKGNTVIKNTTLKALKEYDATERDLLSWIFGGKENSGLKAETSDKLQVKFHFVDNGKDQNVFQGDKLHLNWTFEAEQTRGTAK